MNKRLFIPAGLGQRRTNALADPLAPDVIRPGRQNSQFA